jgi:hypothetical protein
VLANSAINRYSQSKRSEGAKEGRESQEGYEIFEGCLIKKQRLVPIIIMNIVVNN